MPKLKNQGSISPTFYEQLLRKQIPKAQKDSQVKQLFALSGSAGVKAARKHVDEIDPWLQVLNVFAIQRQIWSHKRVNSCKDILCIQLNIWDE